MSSPYLRALATSFLPMTNSTAPRVCTSRPCASAASTELSGRWRANDLARACLVIGNSTPTNSLSYIDSLLALLLLQRTLASRANGQDSQRSLIQFTLPARSSVLQARHPRSCVRAHV